MSSAHESNFELYREAVLGPATQPAQKRVERYGAILKGLAAGAADLLYPAHCMACGEGVGSAGALCEPCALKIQWIGPDRCLRCGAGVGLHRGAVASCPECETHPPAFVESACAVAKYGDPLRALILGLKFGGGLQAVPLLARLLTARLRATQLLAGAADWAIVPVPLARPDFSHRGFNQAEELAAALAPLFKLRLEPALLRKVRSTKPQATLDHTARAENLRGVFAADAKRAALCAATGVLLIDDVMTTGATLAECARTLHLAGIKRVRCAVVARG